MNNFLYHQDYCAWHNTAAYVKKSIGAIESSVSVTGWMPMQLLPFNDMLMLFRLSKK